MLLTMKMCQRKEYLQYITSVYTNKKIDNQINGSKTSSHVKNDFYRLMK